MVESNLHPIWPNGWPRPSPAPDGALGLESLCGRSAGAGTSCSGVSAVRRARSARAACSGTASAGTTSTSAWMTPPGSPPSRSSPMVGQTTAGFLERALEHYRELGIRARRVLTDNGSAYSSRAFAIVCARRRVRHRRTRPYTPRTNGKVERFIQSMLRECAYQRPYFSSADRRRALAAWVQHHNCRRVHPALGTTPLARLGSRARTTSWLSTPNARASASDLAASMWTPHPPRRRWGCQDDTEQAAAGLAGRPRRTPSSTER